jgi:hypothetical protein
MTVTPEKWGTFKKELEALGAQVIRDAEQAA